MTSAQPGRLLPPKAIIGMIHVPALPGTPASTSTVAELAAACAAEARQLTEAGCDALLIENMHDRPYLRRRVGPEIVAAMTAAGLAVRQASPLPLGVQILAGANRAALAVAHACGAQFVRVEGFVFSHVADEGLMAEADAGRLLRYRRSIGAESIAVFADIKKKHSAHAITADVSLAETAEAAAFFGADALIVTGAATGKPTSPADLQAVAGAVEIPLYVGSGTTPGNLAALWPYASGFIVGSYLKCDGLWCNPIDPARLAEFLAKVRRLRGGAGG
jgi:membrane complex biogenesis BtpA family protein